MHARLPLWVKTGKALGEHMFSALPPKADSSRTSRYVRIVPIADIVVVAAQHTKNRQLRRAVARGTIRPPD